MAAVSPPRPLVADDDRSGFDCGRDSLDNWFRRHAWDNQASGASRVNIIADVETGRIIGYVTLCAAQVERDVAELEADVSRLTGILDDPELYTRPKGVEQAHRLGVDLDKARKRLDRALAEWEKHTAQLESLERATTAS